jgi:hypothetical protein
MQTLTLKQIPKGEFLMRKPNAKTVYIKGDYCRESKAYWIFKAEDINSGMLLKARTLVIVGFTY